MQKVEGVTQRLKKWLCYVVIGCMAGTMPVPAISARYSPSLYDQSKYSMLVINAKTGRVMFQENAGKYRYPASLTKLMTLYLTFEALKSGRLRYNTMLHVSAHAASQAPTKLGLPAGSTIPLYDAMMAVIIKSANDMAVVLAEAQAPSESQFAVKMTQKARSLGMGHTIFRNASGLPDFQQKTTAYDLARLAMALHRDFPEYYPLFSRTSHRYKNIVVGTHNRVLVSYRGADGLKTGYINASGFNLVTSAERNGKRLIGVVMGGRTARGRDAHMMSLLDRAFASLNNTNSFNDVFASRVPVPMWKPGTYRQPALASNQAVKKNFSGRLDRVLPAPGIRPEIEISNTPAPQLRPKLD